MADLPEALAGAERFLVVLAGPNGAGKSTFFDLYLAPLALPFVNADRIAGTLGADAPAGFAYASAAAAEQVRTALVERGVSFCMETVFSDAAGAKIAFLRDAQARGYAVVLVFVGLESPELCSARVSQRVAAGGHDVPDEKIRSRYPRTLENLRAALEFADGAYLFDNSACDHPYRLVATYRAGRVDNRNPPVPHWAEALPGLPGTGRSPKAPGRPRGGRAARRRP